MHAISEWSNYFVAMTSASAALCGLLFVGLTISLQKVLTISHLPDRALQSLVFLLTILIVSTLGLVPGQSYQLYGAEVFSIGVFTIVLNNILQYRMSKRADRAYRKYVRQNVFSTQLANIPYIIAGVTIFLYEYHGIYWLIPAFCFSFLKAVVDSWVLIVEVNR